MVPSLDSNASSVSSEEIKRFESVADAFWDEQGPYRFLHQLNPLRLRFARDYLQQHLKLKKTKKVLSGIRLLDVGCGGGLTAEPLARMGATVTGLDASAGAIDVAKGHAVSQGLNIDYHATSLETFLKKKPGFDAITAFELLEHVNHPGSFLKECRSFLRPGGVVLLSTLNRTFLSYALGIVGAEYLLNIVPRGTHQWEKFITPYEVRWMLERAGFEHIAFKGMTLRPLSQTWELSDNLAMNYLVGAVAGS